MLKARSTFIGFLRCPPGRHEAFVTWHDTDHRPENVGQIEHVYHSERWVAPPHLAAARLVDAAGLVPDPGQYVHTYWSTATPEQLVYDMTVVHERLQAQGRCEPINRDFTAMWRDRMHPVNALVRPGGPLGVDALPVAPHDGCRGDAARTASGRPDVSVAIRARRLARPGHTAQRARPLLVHAGEQDRPAPRRPPLLRRRRPPRGSARHRHDRGSDRRHQRPHPRSWGVRRVDRRRARARTTDADK